MKYVILFLWTSPAFALLPVWEKLRTANEVAPLTLFRDIAKIRRPSKSEHQICAFVRNLTSEARELRWAGRPGLDLSEDDLGNIRIAVPATGRFKDQNYRSVALQAHVDMIEAAAEGKDAVDEAFANGVRLTETDGWIHSVGNQTSIGADNGVGLAMALEYVIDPSLEHPPLEIFLTVNEEQGMTGAIGFALPFHSACLINLDWNADGVLGFACTGAAVMVATGDLATTRISKYHQIMTLTLAGLPGGHSAVDIVDGRPSAIRLGADLVRRTLAADAKLRLVEVDAGDPRAPNAITERWEARVSGPRPNLELAALVAEQLFAKERARDWRWGLGARLTHSIAPAEGSERVVKPRVAAKWLNLPNRLLEGVIDRNSLEPGWDTSSSTGLMTLSWEKARLGYMTRAFDVARGQDVTDQNRDVLDKYWPGWVLVEGARMSSSWMTDVDTFLYHAAARLPTPPQLVRAGGGLKIKHFQSPRPWVPMTSMGVNILNMHSNTERFEVASLVRSRQTLQDLLIEVGSCDEMLVHSADQ